MTETLHGQHVMLRPPRPSDKQDRLTLGRNLDIARMFGGSSRTIGPLTDAEVDEWYAAIESDPHGWMIEHAGRCIGNARLHSLEPEARTARYAVGILQPALLGQGLGREVTALVLAYAFEALNLRRVDLRVLAFNTRAIRSYEAAGFEQTGLEHHVIRIDDEWHDDVLMSISRDDWLARTT